LYNGDSNQGINILISEQQMRMEVKPLIKVFLNLKKDLVAGEY